MRPLLALALAATPLTASAADFAVGQTLACTSKDPAKRLFAVVGRIEPFGADTAVSISLYNLAKGAQLPEVGHLPVAMKTLSASCAPSSGITLPIHTDFEGGYAMWREAVAGQRAGVFTIPVDEIEDFIRKQAQGLQPSGAGS